MPFSNPLEIKSKISEMDETKFFSLFFFEYIPAVFKNDADAWTDWKIQLSLELGVDPQEIRIVGSAALGFSLNPDKNFRQFGNYSDIDCAIVSDYHFNLAWHHLRQARTNWATIDKKQKTQ